MKPALLGAALAAFVTCSPLPATTVDSRISAVTVYTDRAVVTRTAEVELAAGEAQLVFADLPDSLSEQSLQFSGTGSASVTILDVAAARSFLEHAADERVKAAEAQLEQLQREPRTLNNEEALLTSRLAMIDRMEIALTAPGSKDLERPQVDSLGQALNFITDQRAKAARESAELADREVALQRRIETAQAELRQLTGSGRQAVKNVTVRVAVAQPGSLQATLRYAVGGASWMPTYDVRVNGGEAAATLAYFGVVRQRTGEDWTRVALTLSTARPALGGAAPSLPAWEISEYRPRPMPTAARAESSERKLLSFGATAAAPADAAGSMPLSDARLAQAAVESGTTSASFRIEMPADVPSDGSSQKVPIATARLSARPEYLAVPKKQETAFLTSKVTNSSEFPLLAGQMNVFLDGTFVATSSLKTVMPGERFDLALGADEGVSVKHKQVQKFLEETGLTNSGSRYTYEYLISLQNNKPVPTRIVVHDQIPVSRHEKIVVKQLAPSEREMKPDAEGSLKWTLDLKPGEKREIPLKFSVEYPNDLAVAGID